jgi:hypothetical protein
MDPQSEVEVSFFMAKMNLTVNRTISLSANSTEMEIGDLPEGSWTWELRAKDSKGTWGPFSNELDLVIDRTAPSSVITYPEKDILRQLNRITGTSDDRGGGVERVKVRIQRGSDGATYDGRDWTTDDMWIEANGTTYWRADCIFPDGVFNVRTKAVDIFGNVQDRAFEISFMVDSIPPSDLSIVINGGENRTRTRQVQLAISCHDDGSGIDGVCLSFDGEEWGPWSDPNAACLLSLGDEEGMRSVFVKVRDRAGNEAGPVFDTIELNSTLPDTETNEDGTEESTDPMPLVALAIIVVITIALLVFLLKGRQRSGWKQE